VAKLNFLLEAVAGTHKYVRYLLPTPIIYTTDIVKTRNPESVGRVLSFAAANFALESEPLALLSRVSELILYTLYSL
jgi:hypothetical protein